MTSFRMFEIILYSMVSLLPYLGLALYPFEDKFRMSKIKLSGCIVILTVIQSALGIYATMCSQEQKALFSLLSTVCYGGFYFLAIKENVGKLVLGGKEVFHLLAGIAGIERCFIRAIVLHGHSRLSSIKYCFHFTQNPLF